MLRTLVTELCVLCLVSALGREPRAGAGGFGVRRAVCQRGCAELQPHRRGREPPVCLLLTAALVGALVFWVKQQETILCRLVS